MEIYLYNRIMDSIDYSAHVFLSFRQLTRTRYWERAKLVWSSVRYKFHSSLPRIFHSSALLLAPSLVDHCAHKMYEFSIIMSTFRLCTFNKILLLNSIQSRFAIPHSLFRGQIVLYSVLRKYTFKKIQLLLNDWLEFQK